MDETISEDDVLSRLSQKKEKREIPKNSLVLSIKTTSSRDTKITFKTHPSNKKPIGITSISASEEITEFVPTGLAPPPLPVSLELRFEHNNALIQQNQSVLMYLTYFGQLVDLVTDSNRQLLVTRAAAWKGMPDLLKESIKYKDFATEKLSDLLMKMAIDRTGSVQRTIEKVDVLKFNETIELEFNGRGLVIDTHINIAKANIQNNLKEIGRLIEASDNRPIDRVGINVYHVLRWLPSFDEHHEWRSAFKSYTDGVKNYNGSEETNSIENMRSRVTESTVDFLEQFKILAGEFPEMISLMDANFSVDVIELMMIPGLYVLLVSVFSLLHEITDSVIKCNNIETQMAYMKAILMGFATLKEPESYLTGAWLIFTQKIVGSFEFYKHLPEDLPVVKQHLESFGTNVGNRMKENDRVLLRLIG